MHDSTFRQRFIVQDVGTETLIYDEVRHKAFCLNQVSGLIWKLAERQSGVKQLAEAASGELQHAVSEEIVRFALSALYCDGLLEDGIGLVGAQGVSRREIVRKLGAGAVLMMPLVTSVFAPTPAFAASAPDCGGGDGGHRRHHGWEDGDSEPPEGRDSTLDPMEFSGRSEGRSSDVEGASQEDVLQPGPSF